LHRSADRQRGGRGSRSVQATGECALQPAGQTHRPHLRDEHGDGADGGLGSRHRHRQPHRRRLRQQQRRVGAVGRLPAQALATHHAHHRRCGQQQREFGRRRRRLRVVTKNFQAANPCRRLRAGPALPLRGIDMNKRIYSLIWNQALGHTIVASELAVRQHGGASHTAAQCPSPRRALLALALLAAIAAPLPVLAGETCTGPTGANATGLNAVACGTYASAGVPAALRSAPAVLPAASPVPRSAATAPPAALSALHSGSTAPPAITAPRWAIEAPPAATRVPRSAAEAWPAAMSVPRSVTKALPVAMTAPRSVSSAPPAAVAAQRSASTAPPAVMAARRSAPTAPPAAFPAPHSVSTAPPVAI